MHSNEIQVAISRLYTHRRVVAATVNTVYRGDDFHYRLGSSPELWHTPKGITEVVTHVYATATLQTGNSTIGMFAVISVEDGAEHDQLLLTAIDRLRHMLPTEAGEESET